EDRQVPRRAETMNFFTELKRRKVLKVGAAYLIVAWLAVQAASIGFPAFDAPPWVLRIFILIALLGFPIAVVMAWVFDVTREGVARTSVFQFKDKGGDIREIGRKLGVTNVVEGSVRRDGPEVRITAQLVRVADGFHIWSETYDRKLERVFALQDEIAQRIGAALKLSLGVAAPVTARAPIDPEAYDEYLKGRALLRQRQDLPAAIAHFKKAVTKAPEFAAGWSSLSLTYEVSFWYTPHTTAAFQAELLAGEKAAAERAAALEPDAAPTEHALGNLARAQFHYADAE